MFKIIFRKMLGVKVKVRLCKITPVAVPDNSPNLSGLTQWIFPLTCISSKMSVSNHWASMWLFLSYNLLSCNFTVEEAKNIEDYCKMFLMGQTCVYTSLLLIFHCLELTQ